MLVNLHIANLSRRSSKHTRKMRSCSSQGASNAGPGSLTTLTSLLNSGQELQQKHGSRQVRAPNYVELRDIMHGQCHAMQHAWALTCRIPTCQRGCSMHAWQNTTMCSMARSTQWWGGGIGMSSMGLIRMGMHGMQPEFQQQPALGMGGMGMPRMP
jgi:hypothetical protein